jgi:LPXTG-site transpeptidase (sortase) family protein
VGDAARLGGRGLSTKWEIGAMAAFLGRSWNWAVRSLALAFAVLAGISLIVGTPANAALSPRLRHALHLRHLEHLAYARYLRARPWQVDIPAIGVAVNLATLGDPDGASLPVPPLARAATEAGWYRFTSVPGSVGNSVIVGHVDTYVGPAVFYNLYQLRPGDAIYVTTGAARERFAVHWVHEVTKVRFPVNQIFGDTGRHQLWLITCGGAFDYQTGHYLDNIIVSAVWQPTVKHLTRHRATRRVQHAARRIGKMT